MGNEVRPNGLLLIPRLQTRSEAALQTRRTAFHLARESVEALNSSTDGLLRAVRGELAQTTFHIPPNRLYHSPENGATVVIASGNSIKTERIEQILQTAAGGGFGVHRAPEAQETHAGSTQMDAASKAQDAARIMFESEEDSRREIRKKPFVTLATDQMNKVPAYTFNPTNGVRELTFIPLGKPETENKHNSLGHVQAMFERLSEMAKENGWKTIPFIGELTTVIHNPQLPLEDGVSMQKSAVFLSPVGVAYLAINEGFKEYIERVNQSGFDVTKIAGGLELQVLQDMGIVQFVTGTPEEAQSVHFPLQRTEAWDHSKRVALGEADEKFIEAYFTSDAN